MIRDRLRTLLPDRDSALAFMLAFILVSGAITAVGLAAQPVLADHEEDEKDDGLLDQMFADDSDMSITERVRFAAESVSGLVDRALFGVQTRLGIGNAAAGDAEQWAEDTTEEFNDNSLAYRKYVNARFNGDPQDYDSIKIVFKDGDSEAVRYIESDLTDLDDEAGSEFYNVTMVKQNSWPADGTIVLEGYAAANAAEELRWYRTNYVEESKDPDKAVRRRMANRYIGLVEVDGWGINLNNVSGGGT